MDGPTQRRGPHAGIAPADAYRHGVHRLVLRPRFAELDPYGHVNHAVYVAWLEEGRVRALESVAAGLDSLAHGGFQMVVTRLDVRYRRPVGAGDQVEVRTALAGIGRATATWSQRITLADGSTAVEADVRVGITGRDGRPARPPPGFWEPMTALVVPERP